MLLACLVVLLNITWSGAQNDPSILIFAIHPDGRPVDVKNIQGNGSPCPAQRLIELGLPERLDALSSARREREGMRG